MRNSLKFKITNQAAFKQQLLGWLQQFTEFSYLDSNNNPAAAGYHSYDCLAAAGAIDFISPQTGKAFSELKDFHGSGPDWLFGFLTYDLKNEVEKLVSEKPDHPGFPEMMFFKPLHVIQINGNEVKLETTSDPQIVWEQINNYVLAAKDVSSELKINSRVEKNTYLKNVEIIREHILEGDVYELNYCMEYYAEEAVIAPHDVFSRLIEISPMPFSAFIRFGEKYLICASPERFLKKQGRRLISQPIKGTGKRGKTATEDEMLKKQLRSSEKEQAENVMIVDLVRNDLARSSETGSVKVEELFGIYSFPQLHQMISTVTSEMKEGLHFTDVIKNAFPMGSMTGAPKIRAMQLIEQYESSRRGLYSGAAGYITPEGDFDLNVVIRSILYNAEKKYLSFQVGSAITYDSNAAGEYEECMLKASAIFRVLNGDKSL